MEHGTGQLNEKLKCTYIQIRICQQKGLFEDTKWSLNPFLTFRNTSWYCRNIGATNLYMTTSNYKLKHKEYMRQVKVCLLKP